MRAIVITRGGPPDVLELRDLPVPRPGPHEILVRVHATAINRADLMQRAGHYPAPAGAPADIPGLEYAGIVEDTGADAPRWRRGDRVMGLVGGGSYADYVVTHQDEAVRVPDTLALTDAAAVPEAFITAHDALFTRMDLHADELLLIHAVGSGVGTAALQLAKAAGAFVIGTQRSAWKLERARALGLDAAVAGDPVTFADDVLAALDMARAAGRLRPDDEGRAGVHCILDLVGGDYLDGNLRALRVLGRIAVVGLVAGSRAPLDMRLLLRKRATLIGTVLRARSLHEKVAAARAFERDVVPLLAAGTVRPVIDDVIPLADAARAHAVVERNANFGKIVLRVQE